MYALDYLQHTRRYVLDQETLPLSISTDWFHEQIQAWIHNRTEIDRFTFMSTAKTTKN